MHYTIYKTTNSINGKIYIGKHQTIDLDDGYFGSGKLIARALKKHGIENFQKEILFVFDNEDDMNAKEAELVTEEFCSRLDTYNLCPGGHGGFGYINRQYHLDEVLQTQRRIASAKGSMSIRLKIKEDSNFKERYRQHAYRLTKAFSDKFNSDDDFRARRILHLKEIGKKAQSEEIKTKISETYKRTGHSQGPKNSQFGSMWITDGTKNMKIKKDQPIPNGWSKGRN